MRPLYVIIYLLCATIIVSQVQQINKQTFSSEFGFTFEDFFSSSSNLNRQYFILFYLPEVDTSLDTRDLLHNVAQQFQRMTVQTLKRRGLTQFQQFQHQMKQMISISQIDCGQNKEICEYFNVLQFPKILYLAKNRNIYTYTNWMSPQDVLNFIARPQSNRIDHRYLRQHVVKSPLLGKIQSLFKSEILIYIVVFLIMPFVFGYFVMAKPVKQTIENQDKNKKSKTQNKQKKSSKQKSK